MVCVVRAHVPAPGVAANGAPRALVSRPMRGDGAADWRGPPEEGCGSVSAPYHVSLGGVHNNNKLMSRRVLLIDRPPYYVC